MDDNNNNKLEDEFWDDDPQTSAIYTRSFINDLLGKDETGEAEEEQSVTGSGKKKKRKLWLIPVIIVILFLIFCEKCEYKIYNHFWKSKKMSIF